jgi:hypothetical protein
MKVKVALPVQRWQWQALEIRKKMHGHSVDLATNRRGCSGDLIISTAYVGLVIQLTTKSPGLDDHILRKEGYQGLALSGGRDRGGDGGGGEVDNGGGTFGLGNRLGLGLGLECRDLIWTVLRNYLTRACNQYLSLEWVRDTGQGIDRLSLSISLCSLLTVYLCDKDLPVA